MVVFGPRNAVINWATRNLWETPTSAVLGLSPTGADHLQADLVDHTSLAVDHLTCSSPSDDRCPNKSPVTILSGAHRRKKWPLSQGGKGPTTAYSGVQRAVPNSSFREFVDDAPEGLVHLYSSQGGIRTVKLQGLEPLWAERVTAGSSELRSNP